MAPTGTSIGSPICTLWSTSRLVLGGFASCLKINIFAGKWTWNVHCWSTTAISFLGASMHGGFQILADWKIQRINSECWTRQCHQFCWWLCMPTFTDIEGKEEVLVQLFYSWYSNVPTAKESIKWNDSNFSVNTKNAKISQIWGHIYKGKMERLTWRRRTLKSYRMT